jgi:magnesium chelatase subunit I
MWMQKWSKRKINDQCHGKSFAAAKLRLLETGSEKTSIRLLDFMSIIPSITGKIELVYEGEQEGADHVAKILIDDAIMVQFESLFPEFPSWKKKD